MPTLIVHRAADSRIPVACPYGLHQGFSGSDLHSISGAEHGLMTNEAGRMRALVSRFLQSHSPAIGRGT